MRPLEACAPRPGPTGPIGKSGPDYSIIDQGTANLRDICKGLWPGTYMDRVRGYFQEGLLNKY